MWAGKVFKLVVRPLSALSLVVPMLGVLGVVLLALATTLGALALATAPALAAEGYGVTSTFGTAGAGNGQFAEPDGVAVNQVSEDVYVVDKSNNRVEQFSSTGTFILMFGKEVNKTKVEAAAPESEQNVCTAASHDTCQAGIAGSGADAFSEPNYIAIDNSAGASKGDVYVSDHGNGVIDKFTATGEYISQVAVGAGVLGVAVDGAGNVWAYEENANVSEYSDTGTVEKQFNTGRGVAAGFAVDSADNVYLPFGCACLGKYNSNGEQQAAAETEAISGISALAVDLATNDLYVGLGTKLAEYGPFGEPFGTPLHRSGGHLVAAGGGVAVASTSGTVYMVDSTGDDVAILRLGPEPATPVTQAPTGVSATGATLHGTLTLSPTLSTEYSFAYNVGATCTGGTTTTPVSAGTGSGAKAVSATVSGLEPSRTYSVCLLALNEYGESLGSAISFSTPVLPPGVSGETASAVTPYGARLEGLVNPNNQETTCKVEYGRTTSYGNTLSCEGPLEGFDEAGDPVGVNVAVLLPGTAYHFRVVAENAAHEQTAGTDHEFTTPALEEPIIAGESTSGLTPFEVTLNAEVNPNYQTTTCVFEYASGAAEIGKPQATTVACPSVIASGGAPVGASVTLTGLSAKSTHYYRLVATNATGTKAGAIEEFTTATLESPLVLGEFTLSTTATTASLAAGVNPNYQETSCQFEYGTEPLLGSGVTTVPCEPELLGNGGGLTFPMVLLTGLQQRTTYYYRVVATNASGTTGAASIESFLTLGEPLSTVERAENLTRTTAMLSGTVNPGGVETTYHFVYAEHKRYEEALADGAEDPYTQAGGSITPETNLGAADMSAHAVGPVAIENLQADTTYNYALVSTNSEGTTTSSPTATFTTSPKTPPILGPTSVSGITEGTSTISGSIEPNGLPTHWELKLGMTPGKLESNTSGSLTEAATTIGVVPLEVKLEALEAGTTYYYQFVAINPDDQEEPAATPEGQFTTVPAPPPPMLAPIPAFPLLTLTPYKFPEEEKGQTTGKTIKCPKGKKLSHGKCVKVKSKSKRKAKKSSQNRKRK